MRRKRPAQNIVIIIDVSSEFDKGRKGSQICMLQARVGDVASPAGSSEYVKLLLR